MKKSLLWCDDHEMFLRKMWPQVRKRRLEYFPSTDAKGLFKTLKEALKRTEIVAIFLDFSLRQDAFYNQIGAHKGIVEVIREHTKVPIFIVSVSPEAEEKANELGVGFCKKSNIKSLLSRFD